MSQSLPLCVTIHACATAVYGEPPYRPEHWEVIGLPASCSCYTCGKKGLAAAIAYPTRSGRYACGGCLSREDVEGFSTALEWLRFKVGTRRELVPWPCSVQDIPVAMVLPTLGYMRDLLQVLLPAYDRLAQDADKSARPDLAQLLAVLGNFGVVDDRFGQASESQLVLLNHPRPPEDMEAGCEGCCGQYSVQPPLWNGAQIVLVAHHPAKPDDVGAAFDDRYLAKLLAQALNRVPGVRRVDVVEEAI